MICDAFVKFQLKEKIEGSGFTKRNYFHHKLLA